MAKDDNNSGPQKEEALAAWASLSGAAATMAEEALKKGDLPSAPGLHKPRWCGSKGIWNNCRHLYRR